jgi:hypothetical protein
MDKRYQVFVSSTYEDLQPERQEVMHALLELDCMPAGMELFPAANDDQWTLIKKVIDDSDYYIVIIGGRYGSVGVDGISYTESEYRYALSIEKPIIAFLHKDPGTLPVNKTDQTEDGNKKLNAFRDLAQKKMCKYWISPAELGSVVSRSLIQLIKSNPGIGWIKANQVSSEEATKEILRLRQRVDELQNDINRSRITAPKGSDQFAQGNDEFIVHFSIRCHSNGSESAWENDYDDSYDKDFEDELVITWNNIFAKVAPFLMDECSEKHLKYQLNKSIVNDFKRVENKSKIKEQIAKENFDSQKINIKEDDFQTIKIQLRALGLMTMSQKIQLRDTYWTLTPYGDEVMNSLRAIKTSKNMPGTNMLNRGTNLQER